MLGFASIAVDSRRFFAHHRFDGVRQDHFAFAAPGVDRATGFSIASFGLHKFFRV
jgi:hypothetical protein